MTETTTRTPLHAVPDAPIDPRKLIAKTADVQRRLEVVFDIAMRALHSQPSTVEAIVAELEREAQYKDMEPRHLAFKAGSTVELLENLYGALANANEQRERNQRALSQHKEIVATLQEKTSVKDAKAAGGMREQIAGVYAADVELCGVMQSAEKMRDPIAADVAKMVWACAIVGRRIRCATVTRQLAQARAIVEAIRAHRDMWSAEEAPLLALLQEMRGSTGQLLALPELVWPTTNDPFAVPVLK